MLKDSGASANANDSKSNHRASNQSGESVTLRDIAKELGISHVTVSRALRGEPGISEVRRKQILAAVQKMGYQPNTNAAALGQRRSSVPAQRIASSLAWIHHALDPKQHRQARQFTLYHKGASATARQYGYTLVEFDGRTSSSLVQLRDALKTQIIAGILVPCPFVLPRHWDHFPWQDYPVVRLGILPGPPRLPSVASDHFGNCLLAFEKMRSLGYLRTGFITNRAVDKRPAAGFLAAQLGLPRPHRLPIHFFTSQTNTIIEQQRLDQWIRKYQPDALLTDLATLPQALKSAGYSVPGDIGLATLSTFEHPELAGIDPRPEAIGGAAAEMLVSGLNSHRLNIPASDRELLIPGEWASGSSLPPRADNTAATIANPRNPATKTHRH